MALAQRQQALYGRFAAPAAAAAAAAAACAAACAAAASAVAAAVAAAAAAAAAAVAAAFSRRAAEAIPMRHCAARNRRVVQEAAVKHACAVEMDEALPVPPLCLPQVPARARRRRTDPALTRRPAASRRCQRRWQTLWKVVQRPAGAPAGPHAQQPAATSTVERPHRQGRAGSSRYTISRIMPRRATPNWLLHAAAVLPTAATGISRDCRWWREQCCVVCLIAGSLAYTRQTATASSSMGGCLPHGKDRSSTGRWRERGKQQARKGQG